LKPYGVRVRKQLLGSWDALVTGESDHQKKVKEMGGGVKIPVSGGYLK